MSIDLASGVITEVARASAAIVEVAHTIWTPDDVRRWLVATFIALPTAAIYSRSGGGVSSNNADIPDATFCWIGLLNEIIPDRVVRLSVLIWAKSEAAREVKKRKLLIDIPRASIADACREHGWHRKTFERRVESALKKLAAERSRRDTIDGPVRPSA